jgi:hypothetical protein
MEKLHGQLDAILVAKYCMSNNCKHHAGRFMYFPGGNKMAPELVFVTQFLQNPSLMGYKTGCVESVIQYFHEEEGDNPRRVEGVAESESNLSRLTVSGTIDKDTGSYAWQYYMDYFHVDLTSAARALKVLNPIYNGLDKFQTVYGRITSFGQYLVVIAKIVKVPLIVFDNGKTAFQKTGDRFVVYSWGEAADAINMKIEYKRLNWEERRWETR